MESNRRRNLQALVLLGLAGVFSRPNKEFYETREISKVSPNGSTYKPRKVNSYLPTMMGLPAKHLIKRVRIRSIING